jgi:hypothetical protein
MKKQKIKILPFKNFKVIKLSRYYYINQVNDNEYIKYGEEKFYLIKKSVLVKMGMKFETIPVVYNTPEETDLMIQNLKTFLREKKNELGPMMVDWGYKVKGVNC